MPPVRRRPRSAGLLLLLLAAGAARLSGQTSPDTTITAEGFVERTDSGGWEIMLPQPLTLAGRRVSLGVYRQFIPLPPDAMPRPGRYTARVTLCGIADYTAETQLVVERP